MASQSDKAWYQEVYTNWNDAAGRLVLNGWQQHNHPGIIPATFHKTVNGCKRVLCLTRSPGAKTWCPNSVQMTEPHQFTVLGLGRKYKREV